MATLTVPPPELVLDPPAGPPALEKPVVVRLAGLEYPDGQPVAADDARTLGVLVYRGTSGSEEVWDEAGGAWITSPADETAAAALQPLPLSPPESPGAPWTGTLVAVGQKDAAGDPRFAKAESGAPAYRLRALVIVVRGGVDYRTIGPASPDLLFVSATEQQRFAVQFDTDQASDAGLARLLLKNGALQPAGFLEIRASGGQEIEIANCSWTGAVLARVLLSADGDIHLVPAAGRQIVLEAPLEAELITYQPFGGGARKTL